MNAHEIELAKKNGTIDRIKSRLVDEKIRKKYSVSEQIALLRQRDEKPEEYAAFYEYAEACKAEVKAYLDNPPTGVDMSKVLTLAEYEAMQAAREAAKEAAETPAEGEATEGEEEPAEGEETAAEGVETPAEEIVEA